MTRNLRHVSIGAAAALAVAALALPCTTAAAAGFSPPVPLTPAGEVAQVDAAVAPTGRTAVAWLAAPRPDRDVGRDVVVRVGDTPERLAPAQRIGGSRGAMAPRLAAAPDGTLTVCWEVGAYRRRGAIRCAVAAPGQPFGAAQTLATYARGTQLALTGLTIDGAGRAVAGWKRSSGRNRYSMVAAIAAGGRFGPPQTLGTSDASTEIVLTAAPGGQVVASWSTPTTEAIEPRVPQLATLAPGQPAFGAAAPVALPPGTDVGPVVVLAGGLGLAVYLRSDGGPSALVRQPDGTMRQALVAPAALGGGDSFPVNAYLRFLPDGSSLMMTRVVETADTDCSEETRSQLYAGTLPPGAPGPPAAAPLSDRRQLVSSWAVEQLADGRTIVLWSDGFGPDREGRLEFRVRTPDGAFTRARTIAPAASDYPVLAAAGDHAVLAYVIGERLDGPARVVVSHFRDTPPYAATGPRPKHPFTGCA